MGLPLCPRNMQIADGPIICRVGHCITGILDVLDPGPEPHVHVGTGFPFPGGDKPKEEWEQQFPCAQGHPGCVILGRYRRHRVILCLFLEEVTELLEKWDQASP